jgi:AmmeMemoRadiSam system protein A/AmmeMemoRadiSam system protein B
MQQAAAFLLPHPPIILPQVGRGEESRIRATDQACREAARRIRDLAPETIVLCSPHATSYGDYIHISPGTGASGDFRAFRAPELEISTPYDRDFVIALEEAARVAGISAGTDGEQDPRLDHGTMIPLWYIQKELPGVPVVRIGISGLPRKAHFNLGREIARVADTLARRTVFVASGDLSHRLAPDGPYGYAPEGPEFDREIREIIESGHLERLLDLPRPLARDAGECGLNPLAMAAGFLEGLQVRGELLSYEGPFGVGYGVAAFMPEGDPYVRLARYAIEAWVRKGRIPPMPDWVPDALKTNRAGVFVSIKKHGALRGCIGTISAVTGSVAEEILRNAGSASLEDPRFPPVSPAELPELTVSVDVLGAAEKVDATYKLDPARYGVIVTSGRRRGLLLPNLEGVDTVEKQLAIALSKAGIDDEDPFSIERFEVVRHQ